MHTQYSHTHAHTHNTHTQHTHICYKQLQAIWYCGTLQKISLPLYQTTNLTHTYIAKHFVRILTSLPLRAVLDGCKEWSRGGGGKERGAGNMKERNTLACVISFGSSHVASKHRRTRTHAHTTFNQLHFGAQCNANDCRHCDRANNAIT